MDHPRGRSDGVHRASDDGFEPLLAGLDATVQRPVDRGRDAESATALVVSCPMSQQPEASLWPVDPAWSVQRVTTLGARTWEAQDGDRVVDGTLARLVDERDVRAILVVGHTGCEVIADVYDRWCGPAEPEPAGIALRLDLLESLVDEAADAGLVDETTPIRTARHRLVEQAVVRGVELAAEQLPSSITVAGYVRDQDGVYGTFPGKQHLVCVDGITDTAELETRLPDDESTPIGRLCY